jgi:hemoglobin-like flavoprotein
MPSQSEAQCREDTKQLEQLAKRASLYVLDQSVKRLAIKHFTREISSDSLQDVIDHLAFTISELNNWKGVLTWLDGCK